LQKKVQKFKKIIWERVLAEATSFRGQYHLQYHRPLSSIRHPRKVLLEEGEVLGENSLKYHRRKKGGEVIFLASNPKEKAEKMVFGEKKNFLKAAGNIDKLVVGQEKAYEPLGQVRSIKRETRPPRVGKSSVLA